MHISNHNEGLPSKKIHSKEGESNVYNNIKQEDSFLASHNDHADHSIQATPSTQPNLTLNGFSLESPDSVINHKH